MSEGFVHIPAKPTKFKGVQYRSRLEASWAVFWNHLQDVAAKKNFEFMFEYEPMPEIFLKQVKDMKDSSLNNKNPLFKDIESYRPDFGIAFDGHIAFQEVKPLMPSQQYLAKLKSSAYLFGMLGYSLLLSTGSFRDERHPSTLSFPYDSTITSVELRNFVGGAEAFEIAKNFRWDLYEDRTNG